VWNRIQTPRRVPPKTRTVGSVSCRKNRERGGADRERHKLNKEEGVAEEPESALQSLQDPRGGLAGMEGMVDLTPHWAMVTNAAQYNHGESNTGRVHFLFVLCEKLDNSINATWDNAGDRNIDLYFLYNRNNVLAAVAIRDNGRGMDSKDGLQGYGRIGWSQQKRQEEAERKKNEKIHSDRETEEELEREPLSSINGKIGEYGFGAQASFSLATKETVCTCERGGLLDKGNAVAEMVISQKAFEDKEENNENVFETPVQMRGVGQTCDLWGGPPSHPMRAKIISDKEEADFQQGCGFTMIWIEDLKEEFSNHLKPEGGSSAEYADMLKSKVLPDLARTYHYYLHGKEGMEDLPEDSSDEEECTSDDEESALSPSRAGVSSRKRKAPAQNDSSTAKAQRLLLGGGATAGGPKGKLTMMVHACKDSECVYSKDLAEVNSVETKLHKAKVGEEMDLFIQVKTNAGLTKLYCKLFYCPFVDRETRPADEFEEDEATGILWGMYWQGRWIPYEASDVKLAFLKDLKLRNGTPVPTELTRRVVGRIFASRTMKPESNKLRFCQTPSNLINNQGTRFLVKWDDDQELRESVLKTKIAEFIMKQHDTHDLEIGYGGTMTEVGNTLHFTEMTYGKNSMGSPVRYKEGDRFIYQVRKTFHIQGIIDHFECEKPTGDRETTANALILFRRVPYSLYGNQVCSPMEVTHKLKPVIDEDKWVSQEKRISKQVPAKLHAFAVEPPDGLQSAEGVEVRQNNGAEYARIKKGSRTGPSLEDVFAEPVTAGFFHPPIVVYITGQGTEDKRSSNNKLTHLPSCSGEKKMPIKVVQRVFQTHDLRHVSPKNPEGKLPKETHMTTDALRDFSCVSVEDGIFVFPGKDDFFYNAGKYREELSITVEGGGAKHGSTWKKDAKLEYIVTVVPGAPEKVRVTAKCSELRFGVKAQPAFKACLLDGTEDPDFANDGLDMGNVVRQFPRGTKVEAVDIEPEGLEVQIHDAVLRSEDPSHAEFAMSVDKEAGVEFEQLRCFQPTPVQASCTLRFSVPDGQGEQREFESPGYKFSVSAGDPKDIMILDRQLLDDPDQLRFTNNSVMPELQVGIVDKYLHYVTVGGKNSDVTSIQLTESLTYQGINHQSRLREPARHTVTMKQGCTATLGGRLVRLSSPPVAETESHELLIEGEAKLRNGKTKKFKRRASDLVFQIEPSTVPCSARPFIDSEELPGEDSVYELEGAAGSMVSGVEFVLYDEADNQAASVEDWKVQWPNAKGSDACSVDMGVAKMPSSYKFGTKAGEREPLVVRFTGPRGRSGETFVFEVQLVLVPVAGDPDHWKLCDSNGSQLPGNVAIPCDQPLETKLGVQLFDSHENPVDPREWNAIPMLTFEPIGHENRPTLQGDCESPSYRGHAIFSDARLIAKCGDYELTVSQRDKESGVDIKNLTARVKVVGGSPFCMQIKVKGVPNQAVRNWLTFGGAGREEQQLPSFPSISKIVEMQVGLHDAAGNSVEATVETKKASVTLEGGTLSVGETSRGRSGSLASVQGEFKGKPNTVVFRNLVIEANASNSSGKLVVSCGSLPRVELDLMFKLMNKVVGVEIQSKRDPDKGPMLVGQRLDFELLLTLHTEDKKGIIVDKTKGLKKIKVKCIHQESGEELAVFSSSMVEPRGREGDLHRTFSIGPGKQQSGFKRAGLHTVQVTYTEQRKSITNVLCESDKITTSNELTFNVEGSGSPDQLEERRQSNLHMGVVGNRVSNSLDGPEEDRMILKRTAPLKLQVKDRHGNECAGLSDLCVVARIEQKTEQVAETDAVKFAADFEFDNDAEFESTLQEAKDDKEEKDRRVQEIEGEIKAREEQIEDLERSVRDAEESAHNALQQLESAGLDAGEFEMDNLIQAIRHCDNRIQAIQQGQDTAGRRCRKVPQEIRDLANLAKSENPSEVRGLLVDLIYVEDDKHARFIAWKSGPALLTLIVSSHLVQRDLVRDTRFQGLAILSVEKAAKFQGEVKSNGKLNVYKGPKKHAWRNKYNAVNLVEYSNSDEAQELRHSVGYALLGHYCLIPDKSFDEVENMHLTARSEKLLVPDAISIDDSREIQANGSVGGLIAPQSADDFEVFPGQMDTTAKQIEVLREVRSKCEDLRTAKAAREEGKPTLEAEIGPLKTHLRDKGQELVDAIDALRRLRDERKASRGNRTGRGTLPELDYFGDDREAHGWVTPSGGFAFDVDTNGRAEVAKLSLKANVGNMEGTYTLVCRLYKTIIGTGGRRKLGALYTTDNQNTDVMTID